MTTELNFTETKTEWHGSLKDYIVGFVGAIILTAASFSLVVYKLLAEPHLTYALVILALMQAFLQLVCFLHLKLGFKKDNWDTFVFYFMSLILLIIVIGSLWVMHDLNERMMP